jgi:hypothetical protein
MSKRVLIIATDKEIEGSNLAPKYKQCDVFEVKSEVAAMYYDKEGFAILKNWTAPINEQTNIVTLPNIAPKIENNKSQIMDNIQHHKSKMDFLHDLYARKNKDYGNSFDKSLDEHGVIASVVRLEDKFNRFKKLTKSEQLVNDESIADTLLDMANYAIMTAMWLENQNKQ